jgi:signal transduction histidine kinase
LKSLIDNAIKFTDSGSVQISARHLPEAQRLELRVTDTGKGMARDEVATIFDMFSAGRQLLNAES